jgi:hypothetical protein
LELRGDSRSQQLSSLQQAMPGPLHDLNLNDELLEATQIDAFIRTWDSSSEEEIKEFVKLNLLDVNNFLSPSFACFIYIFLLKLRRYKPKMIIK